MPDGTVVCTLLVSLTRNPDKEIQQSAAIALAESQGPYALKTCIGLIKGEDEVLRSTIVSNWTCTSCRQIWCGDPQFADTLAAYLNTNDPELAASVAIILGQLHDRRAPVGALEALAAVPDDDQGAFITISGNEYTPVSALQELCISGNADATRALIRLTQLAGRKDGFLADVLKTGNASVREAVEAVASDNKAAVGARLAAALALFWGAFQLCRTNAR
jgi:HEAT repeat protein